MSQAGKGDKVAQGYRTPQWENSKLWDKKELSADPEKCYKLGKAHYPQTEQKLKEN